MKRLTSYFLRDISLKKRLIISNLFLILVPMAIVWALFFGRFFSIIERNVLDSQQTTSLQVSSRVENIIATMLLVSDTAASNVKLDAFLTTDKDDFTWNGLRDAGMQTSLNTFQAVLESHIDEENITDIVIYSDAPSDKLNAAFADSDSTIFADLSEVDNTYWMGIFKSSEQTKLVSPGYLLGTSEKKEHGDFAVIRKFTYYDDAVRKQAYIAVYHSLSTLGISLLDSQTIQGGAAYIINTRDYLVASTDEENTGTYMTSYRDLTEKFKGDGAFTFTEIVSKDIFISYRDIDKTDWRLVWVVPYASLLSESKSMIYDFSIVYISLAAVVFLIGLLLSNTIVKRINLLRDQMELVKSERPEPFVQDPGKDEIGELIKSYNYMAGRIAELVDDKLSAADELNTVKIKALRAQIDPHFLYNTLDMINWFSKSGKNQEASAAILALSKFYRLTLNKGNLTTNVEDELSHVTLYVKLMNMRFDNKIQFLIDVPEEMLDYKIPMIIFQPIVENAIQHGIHEADNHESHIIITGWMEKESLCFLVSDNGVGMSEEQVDKILSNSGVGDEDRGIGAYNTHRRLQLSEESGKFGLSYVSSIGIGTEVLIRIPKMIEEVKNANAEQPG